MMDKKPLVSIIIPTYNVEAYLPQCLDSVINQTYSNLEIVVVNDGSSDRCPIIADDYASKDSRISVIHKKNGGLSSARNAALDCVSGDYIAFIDSDDWQSLDAIKSLLDCALATSADVVSSGIYLEYPDSVESTSGNTGEIKLYCKESAFRLLPRSANNVRFEVWNKLFKSTLFENVRFKEGQIYEDIYICRQIFKKVGFLAIIDKPFYHYRLSRPGNTNSFYNGNKFVVFSEMNDFISDMRAEFSEDVVAEYERYSLERALGLYRDLPKFPKERIPEYKNRIISFFGQVYKGYKCHSEKIEPKYSVFYISPTLYSLYIKLFR